MTEGTKDGKKAKMYMEGVTVYHEWCKKCGICISFCPVKVLRFSDRGYPEIKPGAKCIHCGQCDLRCPDFAISGLVKIRFNEEG